METSGEERVQRSAGVSAERLGLLAETSIDLIAVRDPVRMAEALFERVRESVGLDAYFLLALVDGRERLEASAGIPEEIARALAGSAAGGESASTLGDLGFCAYACFPLYSGERILGSLTFASRRNEFDAEDLEFLGTLARYVAAARERMRMEESLAVGKAREAAILDSIGDGFYVLDRDWRFTLFNDQCERYFGLRREAVLGRTYQEVFPQAQGTEFEEKLRIAYTTGEPQHVEGRSPVTHVPIILHAYPSAEGVTVLFNNYRERFAATEALRQSEERYRTLFESIDEGFCVAEMIFDENGKAVDYRFLEINPAFDRFTGIPAEAARSGKTVRELVPNLEEFWYETYGRVATTGEPVRFENGSEALGRWFEVHAVRVKSADGPRVAILFKDVSARKRAELEQRRLLEELRVEREKLQSLFEQAPAFIALLTGPELVFEYVNDAYYGLVGHRELIGRRVLDALPEVAGQPYLEIVRSVLDTGVPFVGTAMPIMLQRTPQGATEERFVDFTYQPMREADGKISGLLAHGVDVTDQVLARRQIAESEERFRTVFENAPDDAIVVADADRRILAWNPAADRICGWTANEAIGRSLDIIFTARDIAEGTPDREAENAARDGKSVDERWHVKKDGSLFWGSGTMSALRNPDQSVRGFLKVFRDATERHELERRITELNQELEARVAERTQELQELVKEAEGFNYSIAHDLRAPLRAMTSTASILLEEAGPELKEEHRDLLVRQSTNAKRLGQLIDQLLRLSRLSRVEVRREPLDMTRKASEVAAMEREQAQSACGIEIQPGMTANGDPDLIRSVLHNLIGNACKFSPQGGTVRVRQEGDVFSVSDEGVGFEMQYVQKIFRPFERLVTEAQFPGTGIGLANVERIVKRHGGRIWAESEPGKGATFFFTLG